MKAAFCLAFLLLPYKREQIVVSGLSLHKFEPSRFGNNKILMKLQLINFLKVWQWKQPNFKIFFSNARIRKNTNLCIYFESNYYWVYYMMTCRSINGNLMRAAGSSIIEVLYPFPMLFPGNRVGGYIVTELGKMNEDVIKALVHVVFVGRNFI